MFLLVWKADVKVYGWASWLIFLSRGHSHIYEHVAVGCKMHSVEIRPDCVYLLKKHQSQTLADCNVQCVNTHLAFSVYPLLLARTSSSLGHVERFLTWEEVSLHGLSRWTVMEELNSQPGNCKKFYSWLPSGNNHPLFSWKRKVWHWNLIFYPRFFSECLNLDACDIKPMHYGIESGVVENSNLSSNCDSLVNICLLVPCSD